MNKNDSGKTTSSKSGKVIERGSSGNSCPPIERFGKRDSTSVPPAEFKGPDNPPSQPRRK